MEHLTITIQVDQSPKEVFDAINHVRDWWQGQIEGHTDTVTDEFTYRMPGHHYSKQRVAELIPGKQIVWLVTDSELKFDQKDEWTGTKIIFDITEANGKTQVRFTHEGLVPSFECYADCSWGWGALIRESLFSLINTGEGKKVFG